MREYRPRQTASSVPPESTVDPGAGGRSGKKPRRDSEGELGPRSASAINHGYGLGGGPSRASFSSSEKWPWAVVPKPGRVAAPPE